MRIKSLNFGKLWQWCLIVTLLMFLSFAVGLDATQADTPSIICTTTGEIDGQGFDVAGFGFDVAGFGFDVAGFGFDVAGFGFDVAGFGFDVAGFGTIEEIIQEMLENKITGDWLVNGLPHVIEGPGYKSEEVYVIFLDDFSTPDAHGWQVRKTAEELLLPLIAAHPLGAPTIYFENVDISSVLNDAAQVAGLLRAKVDPILEANGNAIVSASIGLVPCDFAEEVTLVDDLTGETFETILTFNNEEFMEGPPPGQANLNVRPILECIDLGNYWDHSDNVAWFGYNNPNDVSKEIPIGHKNRFIPRPKDRGQPTVFAPGRNSFVFSAPFRYFVPFWKLDGRHSHWQYYLNGLKRCPDDIPEQNITVAPEGYSVSRYLSDQGIPDQFIPAAIEHLLNSVEEDDTDPFANLDLLSQYYAQKAYEHANDIYPETSFSYAAFASTGNMRYIQPGSFKPGSYSSWIGVNANVGDYGQPWALGQDGNVIAPGICVELTTEAGITTGIGCGTSYATPHMAMLMAPWFSFSDACNFRPGMPPLITDALSKTANYPFTGPITPLDCAHNNPPIIDVIFKNEGGEPVTILIDEGAGPSEPVGTVSDPDGDVVTLTATHDVEVTDNLDGTWSVSADDGTASTLELEVVVTATDSRGASASVVLPLSIVNVAPVAEFNVSSTSVNIGEDVTLSLLNPSDPSDADTTAVWSDETENTFTPFKYTFDCGTESPESPPDYSGSDDSFVCEYEDDGMFTVSATIEDKDGGISFYFEDITVVSTEPEVCYAHNVEHFSQGTKKNGHPIRSSRSIPTMALGAPQDNDTINFVSLGFGDGRPDEEGETIEQSASAATTGILIVDFGSFEIQNDNGTDPDIRVWETTFRDHNHYRPWSRYPETVAVFAANFDYESGWVFLGQTTDKDQAYDLGPLDYATHIKLVEVSNPRRFGRHADGFDVDAVEGFNCLNGGEYDDVEG